MSNRCEAAHADDSRGCVGRLDAVIVQDITGKRAFGCERHAIALLASLDGARVEPGTVPGASVRVYQAAQRRMPFDFRTEDDR